MNRFSDNGEQEEIKSDVFAPSPSKEERFEYESWALVESMRTARGPRQTTVATIGKLPGLDREERIVWEEIGRILDGKPRESLPLFEKAEETPEWATINVRGVQVERLRSFGDVLSRPRIKVLKPANSLSL